MPTPEPVSVIESEAQSAQVAILGADFPGMRIRAEVAPGDRVAAGQVVFRDAKRPRIATVSPVSGTVAAIELGARRMLSALLIEADPGTPPSPTTTSPKGNPRDILLDRGLWPAFVARPFGGPPDPDARPGAIVVSAIAASHTAPDPGQVLQGRGEDLHAGLDALTGLTDGMVHLCLGRNFEVPLPDHPRLHVHRPRMIWRKLTTGGLVARVLGAYWADPVWTIGYQDVVAIGHMLRTGALDPIRSVALTPPGGKPTIVRVPQGSDLHQLFAAEMPRHPSFQTVSGPAARHRFARYLGRHEDEATLALPLRPTRHGQPLPIIPFSAFDRPLPFRVPTVPLLRALALGDEDACARLGCLRLLEEDVAHLSALCASGLDYAVRLREVLDRLRKGMA